MATNKFYYLDYNSTSPLHKNVQSAFVRGDFLFSNSSSQHALGKKLFQNIIQTKKFLFDFFELDMKNYNLFFHSGVTEAVNMFFSDASHAFYAASDHPCVKASASKSKESYELAISSDGILNLDLLNSLTQMKKPRLNLTVVHNETGIVLNSSTIEQVKKINPLIKIHLDAAQFVGKTNTTLPKGFDMASFSGHKFGAFKGIGFSFIAKDFELTPYILGGGQQSGLRSGTINSDGIQSIFYALNERDFLNEYNEVLDFKREIIEMLKPHKNLIYIPNESSNTICLMHKSKRSDEMLIHFDMNGLCVSAGSACAAGSFVKSETLVAMGFSDFADHNIRISLGRELLEERENILTALDKVFNKL